MRIRNLYVERSLSKKEYIQKILESRRTRKKMISDSRYKNYSDVHLSIESLMHILSVSSSMEPIVHKICASYIEQISLVPSLQMTRTQFCKSIRMPVCYLSSKEAIWHGLNGYLHGYDQNENLSEKIGIYFDHALKDSRSQDIGHLCLGIINFNNAIQNNFCNTYFSKSYESLSRVKEIGVNKEISLVFQTISLALQSKSKASMILIGDSKNIINFGIIHKLRSTLEVIDSSKNDVRLRQELKEGEGSTKSGSFVA